MNGRACREAGVQWWRFFFLWPFFPFFLPFLLFLRRLRDAPPADGAARLRLRHREPLTIVSSSSACIAQRAPNYLHFVQTTQLVVTRYTNRETLAVSSSSSIITFLRKSSQIVTIASGVGLWRSFFFTMMRSWSTSIVVEEERCLPVCWPISCFQSIDRSPGSPDSALCRRSVARTISAYRYNATITSCVAMETNPKDATQTLWYIFIHLNNKLQRKDSANTERPHDALWPFLN